MTTRPADLVASASPPVARRDPAADLRPARRGERVALAGRAGIGSPANQAYAKPVGSLRNPPQHVSVSAVDAPQRGLPTSSGASRPARGPDRPRRLATLPLVDGLGRERHGLAVPGPGPAELERERGWARPARRWPAGGPPSCPRARRSGHVDLDRVARLAANSGGRPLERHERRRVGRGREEVARRAPPARCASCVTCSRPKPNATVSAVDSASPPVWAGGAASRARALLAQRLLRDSRSSCAARRATAAGRCLGVLVRVVARPGRSRSASCRRRGRRPRHRRRTAGVVVP